MANCGLQGEFEITENGSIFGHFVILDEMGQTDFERDIDKAAPPHSLPVRKEGVPFKADTYPQSKPICTSSVCLTRRFT